VCNQVERHYSITGECVKVASLVHCRTIWQCMNRLYSYLGGRCDTPQSSSVIRGLEAFTLILAAEVWLTLTQPFRAGHSLWVLHNQMPAFPGVLSTHEMPIFYWVIQC